MGGRGATSTLPSVHVPLRAPAMPRQKIQPVPAAQIEQETPDDSNTPVSATGLADLMQMDDSQLAQAFRDSQRASLPNHLADKSDITQKFVYHMGLNEKPTVLDAAAFSQFMQSNGIPQSQILSRSINGGTLTTTAGSNNRLSAQQIADTLMYSRLTYIGGKHGGQLYGAGTYFDMNGGGNTGYGSGKTLNAVLNPKTAKVITDTALNRKARAFDQSHPQFARATGGYKPMTGSMSVYALVLGYNVIKDASGGYHNIIGREALVYKK